MKAKRSSHSLGIIMTLMLVCVVAIAALLVAATSNSWATTSSNSLPYAAMATPAVLSSKAKLEVAPTHLLITVQPSLITPLPAKINTALVPMPFDAQLPNVKIHQSDRQPKISQQFAMKVIYNISGKQLWASPDGKGVTESGKAVTVSATFGLVNEGSLANGRSWAGTVNLPVSVCDGDGNCKDTGKKIDHLENRPMWIIDYGNLGIPVFDVMCNGCTPAPVNNHMVYFVDADTGSVMLIKQYHQ